MDKDKILEGLNLPVDIRYKRTIPYGFENFWLDDYDFLLHYDFPTMTLNSLYAWAKRYKAIASIIGVRRSEIDKELRETYKKIKEIAHEHGVPAYSGISYDMVSLEGINMDDVDVVLLEHIWRYKTLKIEINFLYKLKEMFLNEHHKAYKRWLAYGGDENNPIVSDELDKVITLQLGDVTLRENFNNEKSG